jgi:hypothetical protein
MLRRFSAVLLAVLFVALASTESAPAAPEEKPGKAEASPQTDQAQIRFADGSSFRVWLLQPNVEVQTKYGKLAIPMNEIRTVEFGLRVPEDVQRRLDAAAAGLTSEDFQAREKATAELLALKELAWPTVRRLARNSDLEVARRAAAVEEKLRGQLTEEQRSMRAYDIIRTDEFEFHGLIQGASMKVRSPYFGDVQVQLADLRHWRRLGGAAAENELRVDAAQHGVINKNWMDTGMTVDGDSTLVITASGEVDMYPIGQYLGMYKTGPAGNAMWGIQPQDGKAPGALIGRIGPNGQEFVIGERYEGKPTHEGKLYLRIGSSPWNNVPSGEFKVKVGTR